MPMCADGFTPIAGEMVTLERPGLRVHHYADVRKQTHRKGRPVSAETSAAAAPASDTRPDSVQVATTQTIELSRVTTRREHDLLGERDIPSSAYWGVHTMRAVENFPITGVPVGHFPDFVRALVYVKQAAARANRRLGYLAPNKADAIERACAIIGNEGKFHDQFVVDAVQGGAGTSTNMNANEVVANVALEFMGKAKGDYAALHPNDDVNMS